MKQLPEAPEVKQARRLSAHLLESVLGFWFGRLFILVVLMTLGLLAVGMSMSGHWPVLCTRPWQLHVAGMHCEELICPAVEQQGELQQLPGCEALCCASPGVPQHCCFPNTSWRLRYTAKHGGVPHYKQGRLCTGLCQTMIFQESILSLCS